MTHPALTVLDGVRWHGEEVVGTRSQRLLAVLAAAAPHAVPTARLVEEVWSDDVPEHPEKALQVLVSRTRSRTAPDVVERNGAGYRMGLEPAQVDALELSRLVGEARAASAAGDHDLARVCAEAALGIPVGGGLDDPVTGELVAGSRDDRLAAQELLGTACLVRGDHGRALELLEPLLEQRPADEELLARVLRSEAVARGVPAALARYAAYDERTREQLGSEPGDRLRRLHLDLLAREAPVREGLTYDAVPMVGRDHDVTAIRELLDRGRMVSVVGPGGLGKTRMAHLVGHLAEQPVVRLVELAGVNDPEGLLPEVATVLGVRDAVSKPLQSGPAPDLRSRIAQQLLGAPTLLVIDNCEHLVEAIADLVAYLVGTVPDLRVLTTSRAPLGIAAETVYLLPQLELDSAVEVFRQRALAARPGVRLDDDEVRRLVERLDGLPLAIELAAAKVRVMSVAEVTRRLEDRFELLRGGDRAAPDRHQTLEAVIDWSWQLLPESPRQALRELSAFPDGFALAGAEAVLGREALTDIGHLAEQSLVVVREDEEMRYRFLETVREYAGHRLDETGDRAAVEERLSAWAVGYARAMSDGLSGADQIPTVTALHEEAGNLNGVLRKALDARDTETVVALLATLAPYWMIRGDHSSVFGLAGAVYDLLEDYQPPPDGIDELRAVLADVTIGTMILGGETLERPLNRLRELGPGPTDARGYGLTRVLLAMFDADELTALEQLTEDDDSGVALTALVWLTQLQENSGELAQAKLTSERALARVEDAAGPWIRAMAESQMAGLAFQGGDPDRALESIRRALPTMEALGAIDDCVQLRGMEAMAELARGDADAAEGILNAVAMNDRARQSLAWIFGANGLAELALARGDVDGGLALYREGVAASRTRSVPGLELDLDLTPWVLFSQACALVAHVRHDRAQEGADLASNLESRLPDLFDLDDKRLDIPVVGGVLFAIGMYRLALGTADPMDAVRLLVIADRFGYYRGIPCLTWEGAVELGERKAPGALAAAEEEYAGRRAMELMEEAAAVAERAML